MRIFMNGSLLGEVAALKTKPPLAVGTGASSRPSQVPIAACIHGQLHFEGFSVMLAEPVTRKDVSIEWVRPTQVIGEEESSSGVF